MRTEQHTRRRQHAKLVALLQQETTARSWPGHSVHLLNRLQHQFLHCYADMHTRIHAQAVNANCKSIVCSIEYQCPNSPDTTRNINSTYKSVQLHQAQIIIIAQTACAVHLQRHAIHTLQGGATSHTFAEVRNRSFQTHTMHKALRLSTTHLPTSERI
jgi:hypothetical protein